MMAPYSTNYAIRRLKRDLALAEIDLQLAELRVKYGTRPSLETRSAGTASVDNRIITVVAVPYEQPAQVLYRGEVWTESFARGAFTGIEQQAGRIRVNRDHDKSRTVGKIIAFRDDPNGLITEIRIARTALGDETLALAAEDMLSASIGFAVPTGGAQLDTRNRTRRVNRAILDHLALVESPAYENASVVGVVA